MENRNGQCVLFEVKPAVGAPEAKVAVAQVKELQERGFNPKTVGGAGQKTLRVVCTAAHQASQRVRKRIEEIFGWTKTTGCFRKTRYRGVERTHAQGQYVVAACNLVRMAKLFVSGPPVTARA